MSRRATPGTRRLAPAKGARADACVTIRFPRGPLLRSVEELDDAGLRRERARHVTTARVVFAQHEVIQYDFPFVRNAALLARDESLKSLRGAARVEAVRRTREEWLLAHAGVVSATQARQAEVNTRILVEGAPREVWRPTRYGRGLVVPVETFEGEGRRSAGLLDLKGAGIAPGRVPSLKHHSSGLCTLGEVFREFLFQTLIDEIFRRAAPRFRTVPAYAVIDLGFDVCLAGSEKAPAGMLVRRAHRRRKGGVELPRRFSVEEQTQVEIELLLRHYGLTSSNHGTRFRFEEGAVGPRVFYAGGEGANLSRDDLKLIQGWLRDARLPLTCDGINIQLARGVESPGATRAQLVDFGHYEVRDRFTEPLVSLVCDQPLRWGAAIRADDPAFVRPSHALCLSESNWGFGRRLDNDTARPRRSEGEGASTLARGLALDFRAGHLTGDAVQQELTRFVAESIRHW